jgi:hypothetical protein
VVLPSDLARYGISGQIESSMRVKNMPVTPSRQHNSLRQLCRDDGLGADKFLGLVWRVWKRLAHILAELSPPMKEVAPCREGTGLKS